MNANRTTIHHPTRSQTRVEVYDAGGSDGWLADLFVNGRHASIEYLRANDERAALKEATAILLNVTDPIC